MQKVFAHLLLHCMHKQASLEMNLLSHTERNETLWTGILQKILIATAYSRLGRLLIAIETKACPGT